MDSKKLIIYGFALLALISVFLIVFYLIFQSSNNTPEVGAPNTNPFGSASGTRAVGAGNPFGDVLSDETEPRGERAGNTINSSQNAPVLRKLYEGASAAVVYQSTDVSGQPTELVRLTDRSSGHVYEIILGESSATTSSMVHSAVKKSNTTIPRIQRALWSSTASSSIFQYIAGVGGQSVSAFIGVFTPPTTTSSSTEEDAKYLEVSGRFLPEGIIDVTYSPTGKQIFYLQPDQSGAVGVIANNDGTEAKEITRFPLSELTAVWATPTDILVVTKPSYSADGFAFIVNPTSGRYRMVLGDIPALSASLSPDGKRLLYYSNREGSHALEVLTIQSGQTTRLSLVTLPEKCVWGPESTTLYCAVPNTLPPVQYPDVWYRGDYSSNDLLWRIAIDTDASDIILDSPYTNNISIDAIALQLSPSERFLTFVDKKTDTLYSVTVPVRVQFGEGEN